MTSGGGNATTDTEANKNERLAFKEAMLNQEQKLDDDDDEDYQNELEYLKRMKAEILGKVEDFDDDYDEDAAHHFEKSLFQNMDPQQPMGGPEILESILEGMPPDQAAAIEAQMKGMTEEQR